MKEERRQLLGSLKSRLWLILVILPIVLFTGCNNSINTVKVVISENASITEKLTAEDLVRDIQKVTALNVLLVDENQLSKGDHSILIGTAFSGTLLQKRLKESGITLTESYPGARGGLWQKVDGKTIVLAGSDIQGMQYAVYDYSKEVLGLDPLIYWTGHSVKKLERNSSIFDFENRTIAPPKVPLLVYFENDVDELANLKEPLLEYDWESYTEMIDALVRMRYNGIHFFDMLGRPEFFLRESYQKLRPGYDVNIEYVQKMFDYAHDKGMLVQIDMSLGYKFKSLESKYADCWKENKDKWVEVWQYYLKDTPIGTADIFSMRPRNQVWDWEYKSTCGEKKEDVFNEVYIVLDSLIDAHNPDAIKVAMCYHDGMEQFNEGFNPPKDWIVVWSDNGYADFDYWPADTKGYQFGTYMHAGFWKNHTVQAPYPDRIDSIMHKMFNEYNATAYCQVNGQNFRPFLLNLEAFSEVCRDSENFSGEGFYDMWLSRYLQDSVKGHGLKVMRAWENASFGNEGYVQELWNIKNIIKYLSTDNPETLKSYSGRIEKTLIDVNDRFIFMKGALFEAGQLLPKAQDSYFFYDQVYYPISIYKELLSFEKVLLQLYRIKKTYLKKSNPNLKKQAIALMKSANFQLKKVYDMRLKGDNNPRWEGWYDPAKRRPNNRFPTFESLKMIEEAIVNNW